MSETPQRIVQGLERKPSTLATIGRSKGGVEERVCLLNVDLLKVSDKCFQKSSAAHRTSEDQKDQVPCSVQGTWDV